MAFWSDTTLDPKRQFKFKVTFSRLNANGGSDSTFLAQSATRPQYTIGDGTQVHFLDKAFHFPGKVTWDPVTITFIDAVSTNVSKDSYRYLQQAGWVNPAGVVGGNVNGGNFATVGKQFAVGAGGQVLIEVLRSTGEVEDRWTLKNAWVTKVALNELNYKAEDVLTAAYTFRYDWAEIVL